MQALDQPDRHQVVVGEHGGRAGAPDLLGRGGPPSSVGGSGPSTVSSAPPREPPRSRRPADLPVGPGTAWAAEQSDVAVAENDQVLDRRPRALATSMTTAGSAGDGTVDHDERHLAGELLDRAVAHARAAQQDPVDLFGQSLHQFLLHRRVFVGVGDEDVVVAAAGLALAPL